MSTGITTNCDTGEFVAGPFKGWIRFPGDPIEYDLGETNEGFELEGAYSVSPILTDAGGDTIQGGIYRGGNFYVNVTLNQFSKQQVRRLTHPFSDYEGQVGVIGCEVSTQAMQLTLRSITEMKNQALTYQFGLFNDPNIEGGVTVDPDVPLRWALQSQLRVLPLRFRAFQFDFQPAGAPSATAFWYITTFPSV